MRLFARNLVPTIEALSGQSGFHRGPLFKTVVNCERTFPDLLRPFRKVKRLLSVSQLNASIISTALMRRCERFFHAPAEEPHPVQKRLIGQLQFPRPSAEMLCAPTESQIDILPRVAHLFHSSCPSTVTRLVIAVVVNTLNRITARTWSHVCQKLRERFFPLFANLYSAPTVVMECLIALVVAPLEHSSPHVIITGHFAQSIRRLFKTATRFCISCIEIAGPNLCLGAAITDARCHAPIERYYLQCVKLTTDERLSHIGIV